MAYIGNARSPLVFGPNTRDDIVPDGITDTFPLSQEVPGGYEANVMVIRQRYIKKHLVTNTNALVFARNVSLIYSTISTSDQDLAAALSRVIPGDFIVISGTGVNSTGTYEITQVTYDGSQIEVKLNPGNQVPVNPNLGGLLDPTDTGKTSIVLQHGMFLPWEVLEPDVDYTIGGASNKEISFTYVPPEDEQIYVLHRGETTYNFVPTTGSVGPSQLQQNLRNFATDRFTGDGTQKSFLLSQEAVDSRSLIVTVNGSLSDGDSLGFTAGAWELTQSVAGSGIYDTVTFDTAPTSGAKIRVLHLGFSTVTRRAAYSPAQSTYLPDNNSVGTAQLQNSSVISAKLADNAVIRAKIQNNAVDGEKILLDNNEALRSKTSTATEYELIKLNSSNQLKITSPNEIQINAPIVPDSPVDLGSSSKRFNDIFSDGVLNTTGSINVDGTVTIDSGQIITQTLNVSGNITVGGTVDGVDISNLKATVDSISFSFPSGCVVPYAGPGFGAQLEPPAGWLWADGTNYAKSSYETLYAAIGVTYGGVAGVNFNVPNLTMRFPIGLGGTLTTLGQTGGQFDHSHQLPDHVHLDTHTHSIPGHNHENNASIGSTLSITTSGSHVTSISHDHAQFSTPSSEGGHSHFLGNVNDVNANTRQVFASSETLIPVTLGGLVGRNPNHEHQLSGNTASQTVNHNHTAQTETENNPSLALHTHQVKTVPFENAGSLGGNTNYHFVVGVPVTGSGVNRNLNTVNDGNHSHDFTVVTTNENPTNHSHPFNTTTTVSGAHDHVVRGTVPSTSSNHQHTIDVPEFVGNSTSNGEHIHSVNNFTGKIGKVTGGVSGDSDITTTARSTTTTGQIADPGPGSTYTANPPFIVLRYIIKT